MRLLRLGVALVLAAQACGEQLADADADQRVGQQVAFGWLPLLVQRGITWVPPWSLVGPVAACWLCLEAVEARHFHPIAARTDSAIAPT